MDFLSKETVQRRKKRGRTELLDVNYILTGERLREVGDVTALMDSMDKMGLESPISVRLLPEEEGRPPYAVVAGARRLAAAKALGWTQIECQVHVNMSDDEALALEIVENLHRLDLTAAERRAQVKMLAKTFERMEGIVRNNFALLPGEEKKRRGRGMPKGVASKVAEATGLSPRRVQQILSEDKPKPAKSPEEVAAKREAARVASLSKGRGKPQALDEEPAVLPGHTSSKKASAPEPTPEPLSEEHSEEGTEGPTVVKFKEAAHKVRIAAPPKVKTVDPVESLAADFLAFAKSRGLDLKVPVSPELMALHAVHWHLDLQRRGNKEAAR